MSIKIRLLLSYLAMTFMPVILFACIAAAIGSAYLNDMAGAGGLKGMPPFWETFNQHRELMDGVQFMAETAPDQFTNRRFLKNIEAKRLKPSYAGLVVIKNKRVIYTSPVNKNTGLFNQLQQLRNGRNLKNADRMLNLQKYNVKFSDQTTGTIFLLSDLAPSINNAKKFFPVIVLSLLLVIGLTNGLLTFLVSRSLIKPLNTLKNAANLMKEGDLDQEVHLKRKDEIGELGAAFEEMRIRLKESIHLQMQYEENRKELISNISHDLKTPITGIKVCVQGLQEGIADTHAKREKYVNMIAKKAENMDHLIDELLLYSKLDLKQLPFHLEPIDLNDYLQDCADELRVDPRFEGIHIIFSKTYLSPVMVIADREKLRRVIMNIIENSLKYMDKLQKEIRMELFDGKEEAVALIADNGPGIESESLQRIFDRFYRAEESRNTATGGSGLGLSIVKQIIEGQGGSVWAETEIGKGTSIFFKLPKAKSEGEHT